MCPNGFKTDVVTPLIKRASLLADGLKNYCPVSGLSFISKLVECVVFKQLLENIKPDHFAYNTGHSTETALLSTKNEIHLSLSRGEPMALVLLDLSAAFDTINDSTHLSCLQTWFGLGGSVLIRFTSYITEHYQSIKIGSTFQIFANFFFFLASPNILFWAHC